MNVVEFDRLVSYFDADLTPLEAAARTAGQIVDGIEKKFKDLNLKIGGSSTGSGLDRELRKAQSDIRKFQSDREKLERDLTRTVEREARQQASVRTREQRRAANAMIAEIDRVNREEQKLANSPGMLSNWGRKVASVIGVGSAGFLAKDFITDSAQLYASLDKLTRFTATLDKNFQSSDALRKFQADIKQLSTEIPHSAENIAKASFTIKSAFQDATEPELIAYLREFGNAATASNTDIASHAVNVAALAKQYNIFGDDLRRFSALIASSFGQALASDEKVAQGFNQVLNSARSTKQPLEDMVAAMSTLQSASSNAEQNTTLLLNVYAKLTDPKYIEGIKAMGVAVFDAQGQFRPLNDIINDLAISLQGLSDEQVNEKLEWAKDLQAREGIKTLIRLIGDYNKTLAEGADQDAFKRKNELMLDSVEAKWERFSNKIANIKMGFGAGMVDFATDTDKFFKTPMPKIDAAGWADAIGKGFAIAIGRASANAEPIAAASGNDIGMAMTLGLKTGIVGGQSGVINAAIDVAYAAYRAAKSALGIQSPSKLFFAIGQDTAQGFIDGLSAMKSSVQAKMASLLDVTGIKGLSKKNDAAGIELLSSLITEISRLNITTKEQEVRLELTAGKYAKLNEKVKERILLAAQELDKHEAWETVMDRVGGLMSRFSDDISPAKTAVEELNEVLAGPETQAALSKIDQKYRTLIVTLAEAAALAKDLHDRPLGAAGEGATTRGDNLPTSGTGSDATIEDLNKRLNENISPPPPDAPWTSFWGRIKRSIMEVQGVTASWKDNLGATLSSAFLNIGDVLTGAVQSWDGTLGGFFKSVGMGFVNMAQQIIQELVRIAIYKAILQLMGSFAGSFGGGGGTVGGPDNFNLLGADAAGSGFIRGFASGGHPAVGRPAIVGEHGPELWMPREAGRIYSNSETKEMLGQKAGNTYNVTNNFIAREDNSFARKSAEQAARAFGGELARTTQRQN